MAAMPEMHQLADDDAADEAHRSLDEAPVEPDGPSMVVASPALPLVGDDHARGRDAGPGPSSLDALG